MLAWKPRGLGSIYPLLFDETLVTDEHDPSFGVVRGMVQAG